MKKRILKKASAVLALVIFFQSAFTYHAFALTAGPESPEFSSFSPVSMTQMVDPFTGSFAYNIPIIDIPGPQGGGYAMALNYNQGAGMETEASWVGHGWSLSPGMINRNKRGFPDTYKDDKVKFYNKTRPSWTVIKPFKKITEENYSRSFGLIPFFSLDYSTAIGNYTGYSRSTTMGLSYKYVSANVNLSGGQVTFDVAINPLSIVNLIASAFIKVKASENADNSKGDKDQESKFQAVMREVKSTGKEVLASALSHYSIGSCFKDVYPSPGKRVKGINYLRRYASQFDMGDWNCGNEKELLNVQLNLRSGYYQQERSVYGYGRSVVEDSDDKNYLTDFFLEKENASYDRNDKSIGIPFNNHDIYTVLAEGLGGSYRYYKSKISTERSEEFKYKIKNRPINIETNGGPVIGGASVGVGFKLPIGKQRVKDESWVRKEYEEEDGFYRFIGDKGGAVEYTSSISSDNTVAEAGILNKRKKTINSPEYTLASGIKRSSYINEDADNETFEITNASGITYNFGLSYCARNETSLNVDIPDVIVEGQNKHKHVSQEGCSKIAYRELELHKDGINYDIPASVISSDNNTTIVGSIANAEYPMGYLITDITGSNYIDVDNNGVSENDFGAWTKFGYRKKSNWYRYRMPFYGFEFNQGSVSDPKDDMGSMSSGEKEVFYMGMVETKTHIAYFITNKTTPESLRTLIDKQTGKGEEKVRGTLQNKGFDYGNFINQIDPKYIQGSGERYDAYGANDIEDLGGGKMKDPMADSKEVALQDENQLEYLQKIVLFSKSRPEKPIKTVRFSYDYSSYPGLPNNINNNTSDFAKSGKLTLKKVWFEYEGIEPLRISPYEFKYEYKKPVPGMVGYEFFNEYNDVCKVQTPGYDNMSLDAWGNIQQYANERNKFGVPWVYQGKTVTPSNKVGDWKNIIGARGEEAFDYAPYHLKQIILPSGGEIHVQYEQHDYSAIQDRNPTTMVSLLKHESDSKTFEDVYINLEDLGIVSGETNETELIDYYVDTLKSYFADGKIYFKFLFSLDENDNNPGIHKRTSEYIEGYANVDADNIIRDYDYTTRKNTIKLPLVSIKKLNGEYGNLPEDALYYFLINNRQGKVNEKGIEKKYEKYFDDKIRSAINKSYSDVKKTRNNGKVNLALHVNALMGKVSLAPGFNLRTPKIKKKSYPLNAQQSYVKLPVLYPKKGGGVRVKRVLFVDHGMEEGDGSIYGTEYIYGTTKEMAYGNGQNVNVPQSWGVATNEPALLGCEHSLRYFMPKKKQGIFNFLCAGRDKEQHEGPFGESVLPSPSIGYEKVVTKNIHSKKSNEGFVLSEFYTVKDYPYDKFYPESPNSDFSGRAVDRTKLGGDNLKKRFPLNLGIFYHTGAWMTQGSRFIDVNRHGVQKKTTNFAGEYNGEDDFTKFKIVSSVEYEYYEPGEKVRVWNGVDIDYKMPGKEMDITESSKLLTDAQTQLSLELDIGLIITFPPIFRFSVWPSFFTRKNVLGKHAISKVISYPTIVKSVKQMKNNVTSVQEMLVFNEATGAPVVTRTMDSYDGYAYEDEHRGELYTMSIPAMWKYSYFDTKDAGGTNQLAATMAKIVAYGDKMFPSGKSPDDFDKDWIKAPEGVLSASVTKYAQEQSNWTNSYYDNYNLSDFSQDIYAKLQNVYRPLATYSYLALRDENDDMVNEMNIDGLNFENNSFRIPSEKMFSLLKTEALFPQTVPDNKNFGWIKTAEATAYTPDGVAMEEDDAQGVKSVVKFGPQYGNLLPVIVAKNAGYGEIYFEDFEGGVDDNNTTDVATTTCHSGTYALCKKVKANSWFPIIENAITANCEIPKSGGELYFWTKANAEQISGRIISNGISTGSRNVEFIVRSQDWNLCRIVFPKADFVAGATHSVELNKKMNYGNSLYDIYIDDIRFQPAMSDVSCYTYDVQTHKLLVAFNSLHLGMFYQYDEEGQLKRKLIETSRYGKRTVQEESTHIRTKNR